MNGLSALPLEKYLISNQNQNNSTGSSIYDSNKYTADSEQARNQFATLYGVDPNMITLTPEAS